MQTNKHSNRNGRNCILKAQKINTHSTILRNFTKFHTKQTINYYTVLY